jgi:hypothetical protein
MEQPHALADCPECRGVRTVIMDVCYVCFAELAERSDDETADALA